MKTRTTLILLLLAVGLGVWIKYFESKKPNTVESQREAGNVVNFDREKIEGIVIQNGDDRIELRREKGNWRLIAPVNSLGSDGFEMKSNAPRARPCWRSSSRVSICTGMCRRLGSCFSRLSTV